jgi:hypothetical protein
MVISPAGPGTKNDCAGKGQQQFTQLTEQESERLSLLDSQSHEKNMVMSLTGPRTKNDCWEGLAANYLTD